MDGSSGHGDASGRGEAATSREDTEGWRAALAEAELPRAGWDAEVERGHRHGLTAAPSIEDRSIPTFSRGELPHFAGISTFLKAPYVEDVTTVGAYDVAIVGAPLDTGTTYRPGTRFGPQAMRRISALYTPYSYEAGVDLREQLRIADLGDIFVIPANIEKAFDQISRGVSHIVRHGTFPVVLGGDHSIGYPTVRALAPHVDGNVGIIHFDRHADTQEKDLDERMHTTPWFHATNIPNAPAANLVQVGIGGWQVPREGVQVARERGTTIMTIGDIETRGLDATVDLALEIATRDAEVVWLSFDIDVIDAGFVPGTGWPEPGGLLPREALAMIGRISREAPLAGMELVEVSPPYDVSDMTALMGTRVIVDTLAGLVASGRLPRTVPDWLVPDVPDEPWAR